MPSNHLILCCPLSPPALNVSQHQCLFQWVSSSHQVAKVLELQFHHQSFQWIFRVWMFAVYLVLCWILYVGCIVKSRTQPCENRWWYSCFTDKLTVLFGHGMAESRFKSRKFGFHLLLWTAILFWFGSWASFVFFFFFLAWCSFRDQSGNYPGSGSNTEETFPLVCWRTSQISLGQHPRGHIGSHPPKSTPKDICWQSSWHHWWSEEEPFHCSPNCP